MASKAIERGELAVTGEERGMQVRLEHPAAWEEVASNSALACAQRRPL